MQTNQIKESTCALEHVGDVQEVGKVRIIDVGPGYKKFFDYRTSGVSSLPSGSGICLNPFSTICSEDTAVTEEDLMATTSIIAQICFYSEADAPSTGDVKLVESAVRWAFKVKGRAAGTDDVREYLANISKYVPDGFEEPGMVHRAMDIALNMARFCTGGLYGNLFNGGATDVSEIIAH